MIPDNLLLIMNHVPPGSGKHEAIKRIYEGQTNLAKNLVMLSYYWKIKIWYDKEVEVRVRRSRRVLRKDPDGSTLMVFRDREKAKVHTFNRISSYNNELLYRTTRRSTVGYYLPMEGILKYKLVSKG
jgi:hypothetical protein